MERIDRISILPERPKTDGSLRKLFKAEKRGRLLNKTGLGLIDRSENRSRVAGRYEVAAKIDGLSGLDREFPFLKSLAAEPFPVRLALQLKEAARIIRNEPFTFVVPSQEVAANADEK